MPIPSRIPDTTMSPQNSDQIDRLLLAKEVAKYLCLSTKTLEKYRYQGRGPAYISVGGRSKILYRRSDVDAWIGAHLQTSTAQNKPLLTQCLPRQRRLIPRQE